MRLDSFNEHTSRRESPASAGSVGSVGNVLSDVSKSLSPSLIFFFNFCGIISQEILFVFFKSTVHYSLIKYH